jgi:hypothetical protein
MIGIFGFLLFLPKKSSFVINANMTAISFVAYEKFKDKQ